MNTLTIDLDTLNPVRAEEIAGFILMYANPDLGRAELKEVLTDLYQPQSVGLTPAPPVIDPAAAFGGAAQGKISEAAPSVEIPNPTSAPVVATTAPAVHTSNSGVSSAVTLDKDGLPWDSRIHASSKALNSDGTWRLKRGLQKDYLDKITAELRKVLAIPSPGPQLVQTAPPPPQQAAAAPPPPPAGGSAEELRDKYIALYTRISSAMNAGKITQAQLDTCLTSMGVPNMPSLGARMDLVPQACLLIDGVIAGASA